MRHGDAAGSLEGEAPVERQAKPLGRPVSDNLLGEACDLLKAILAEQRRTNELLAGFAKARAAAAQRPAQQPASGTTQRSAPGGGEVANAAELDGPHGDPTVKRSPPRWIQDGGRDFAGWKFSECPPEFLEALADFNDWKASKPQPGKEKYAEYDRKDAARARGWAERARRGETRPAPATAPAEPEMIP